MFFKSIEPHLVGMNLSIVVTKTENGLTVSVLPQLTCKDETKKNIIPILLKGTAEELDAQFAGIIQQPLEKVSGLSSNLIQFEKNAEIAAEKSAIKKAEKEATKKLTDKADKELKKAEEFIEKNDIKKAILKIEAALKFAPNYSKAINMLAKHKPKPAGMFEEVKEETVIPKTVAEVEAIEEAKKVEPATPEVVAKVAKAETVEEVKSTVDVVKPIQEDNNVTLEQVEAELRGEIPVAKQEKVEAILDEEEAINIGEPTLPPVQDEPQVPMEPTKREAPQGPNVIINKVPAEPIPVEPIAITPVVYDKVDDNGKPTRQDMEPMSNFESRLEAWESTQPQNPAATQPSATPTEAPVSELEAMTIEETAGREAAFEAEKVEQPIKAETPPSQASDNIETLG